MRSQTSLVLLFCLAALSSGCSAEQETALPVGQDVAKVWIRYLVPLPKSIQIANKVVLKPAEVAVVPPHTPDMVCDQAVKELRQALNQEQPPNSAIFRIEMGIGGPEAENLRSLRNSDQAYSIKPLQDNRGLKLVALSSRGLYYASKTLQQALRAFSARDSLEIPLLKVVDWPDLEERGLWGGDSAMNVEWLAERKMNVTENISSRHVTREGRGHSGPKGYWENAPTEGPIRAVNVVPAVLHLEQIAGPYKDEKGEYTLFDVYPMLRGVNKAGRSVICYSQPQFVDVLADWIVDLKNLPNTKEVSVWLTENLGGQGGCRCKKCAKQDRNLLELRTVLAAWRKAQERIGSKFGLRVLTSEETRPSEKAMFAELPLDVKLLYYDSLFTYTTGKEPMINPNVESFIKRGGWVAPVPNLSAFVRLVNPFTCPDFSHYRLNEFVDKGCSGLLGYACMGLMNSRFVVEAAAEWAWNAKGRSPEEFAISWAVREGLKDPVKFVEWNKLHAPVAWDVYGSDFPAKNPAQAKKRSIATLIRTGTLPPLGWTQGATRSPWGQIKSVAQFDDDVAAEAKALELAREMGIPEFLQETLVVDGYIRAMRAGYDLGKLIKNGKIAPGKKQEARKLMQTYVDCLRQSAQALPKWLQAISKSAVPPRGIGSVETIYDCIADMKQLATEMQIDLK